MFAERNPDALREERATVLESTYPAKVLKNLIGRAEFLVAERIHSMIGAVGVSTPFLCLGSRSDRRIFGIIEEMAGMRDAIYFLNSPSREGVIAAFESAWERRSELASHLTTVSDELMRDLSKAANTMRNAIAANQA